MSDRRLSQALTSLAALTFPRSRGTDGRVVRDCAREAVDAAGLRALPRECLSLVAAGLRARAGAAAGETWHAPWRQALSALALPLAAAVLLVWTFGFIPRYDHWPPGEGWALLLGGALVAVVGAALERRRLAAAGATAIFLAAASPHIGLGTEAALADTPSFFQGQGVDIAAASLLPTLLLVAGVLSLPRGRHRPVRVLLARMAAGLAPAVVAAVYLLPAPKPEPTYGLAFHGPGAEPTVAVGPPYPMPWIAPSGALLAGLGIALAVAVAVTWRRSRAHPAGALASGLVLASVAYPLVWVGLRHLPTPYWAYNGAYPLLLAAVPLLVALTLMRRAGRVTAAAR